MHRFSIGLTLAVVPSILVHAQPAPSSPAAPIQPPLDSVARELARRVGAAADTGRRISFSDRMLVVVPDTTRYHMPTVHPDLAPYRMPILSLPTRTAPGAGRP
jgi:hypothetical protein